MNWGWYGIENGYFDIALLNVLQYTYDDWQAMYVGLYPNRSHLTGDINGDGEVNIDDLTALVDFLLGGDDGNDAADVNEDGLVNIDDLTALIDKLLSDE